MPYVDEYGRIISEDAPVPARMRGDPNYPGPQWTQEPMPASTQPAQPQQRSPRTQVNYVTPPSQQSGNAQPQRGRSDPNMLSTESTKDQLSPTSLVLNYLKSKGIQPTADNIRRAVTANAMEPGQFGPFTISDERPGGTQLRNAGVEDTPARAISRAIQPARWDLTEPDARWDVPGQAPGLRDARPIIGNKTMPPPGPGEPMELPKVPLPTLPPEGGAPVSPGGQPQMPPPTPGAAVAQPPPPPNSQEVAMQRALEGPRPPGQLALPAPEAPVRPAIAAPPPVPQIEAPPRQLALPAPEAPRALPAPDLPTGNFSPSAPKAAPGKPVQGYPIEQTPLSRGAGRVMSGIAGGAARGGVPGAIVGGAASAAGPLLDALGPSAKELVPYIMRNLHLQ